MSVQIAEDSLYSLFKLHKITIIIFCKKRFLTVECLKVHLKHHKAQIKSLQEESLVEVNQAIFAWSFVWNKEDIFIQ